MRKLKKEADEYIQSRKDFRELGITNYDEFDNGEMFAQHDGLELDIGTANHDELDNMDINKMSLKDCVRMYFQ